MTNAERIRTMTVDELAELMNALIMDDIDYARTFCDMCNGQYECEDCCRWWLAQDADAYNGLNRYSIFYLPPREDYIEPNGCKSNGGCAEPPKEET